MLPYSTTKVTMELRDVLASLDENGQPFKLWDFDYPSYYKGEEKTAFEQKVIDHYLFHQIGVETIARFKHNFKTRIREIMPYYLQMYKSVEIMDGVDDPFGNVDIVETFEQESTGTSSGSSSSNETRSGSEDSEHRFSNTPQGSINNIDDYMTEAARDNKSQDETVETNGASESENSGTVKHTLTRKGNQGVNTYAHDMIEYRQSFIDVDMMIIGALHDLFLLVY